MTTAQMIQTGLGVVSTVDALNRNSQQQDLADRQVSLAEQQQQRNQDLLDELSPLIKQSIQQQLEAGNLSMQRSADLWAEYQKTWQPLQQQYAQRVAGFDTPTRREEAALSAVGDVRSAYDQQRQDAERQMVAAGLDPSTIAALGTSSRVLQAKDEAGAANKARTDTELIGLDLLGRGVNASQGISTLAGNTATQGGQQFSGAQTGANNLITSNNNASAGLDMALTRAGIATGNANAQRNALIGDLIKAGAGLTGMYGG